jgi:Predicted flavin-nucleotide-binding protein
MTNTKPSPDARQNAPDSTPRPVRRKDRQLNDEAALALLNQGEYGILGLADLGGQPYPVPFSYLFKDGRIFFHSAREGRKIEIIKANPRACFVVVGQTKPVWDGGCATYYESVMVFGQVREVTDDDEKYAALYGLSAKYLPGDLDKADDYIKHMFSRTLVFALEAETITGKGKLEKQPK